MPDYNISTSNFPTGGTAGTAYSGNFVITNGGTLNGSSTITWNVYLSTNSTYDIGDTLIQSGTTPASNVGMSSPTITYNGIWPVAPDSYYIILVISATDDTNTGNNTRVSSALTVGVADYTITTPSFPTYGLINNTINGNFIITNTGGDIRGSTHHMEGLYVQ